MDSMSDINELPSIDELTKVTGQTPVDGHDAWVKATVKKRLDQKQAGKMNYRTIDEVAEDFGFYAR